MASTRQASAPAPEPEAGHIAEGDERKLKQEIDKLQHRLTVFLVVGLPLSSYMGRSLMLLDPWDDSLSTTYTMWVTLLFAISVAAVAGASLLICLLPDTNPTKNLGRDSDKHGPIIGDKNA